MKSILNIYFRAFLGQVVYKSGLVANMVNSSDLIEQYLLGQTSADFKKAYDEICNMRPLSARLDIAAIQERRT